MGDDDGGTLFSPKDFEAYKKRVTPMVIHKLSKNNSQSLICQVIDPYTYMNNGPYESDYFFFAEN